ncbi:hypothetical protein [Haloferula sp.]|uniref:hypothetical protein n=1 Tax=Haloferula sp. TaxID=2497595 RepID=UPI00329B1ADF
MKSSFFTSTRFAVVACVAFTSPSSHAVEVFSADTGNITAVNNNGAGTISGATPDLIVTNASVSNNMGGFASTSDINTLNGSALTAADTVTIKVTVDSLTVGNLRANGVEFGMASAVGFRPANSLLIGMAGSNNGSDVRIVAGSFQDAGTLEFNSSQADIIDGFSITLTANAAGYTFFLEDILVAGSTNPAYSNGDTTATISGTFSGTEFLDNFSTGHFYSAVQQQTAGAAMVADYSVATIDVVNVPDMDSDGMPDSYEDATPGLNKNFAGDASQGANDGMFDNDGRTNLEEYQDGTDPNVADVDMDNLTDGEEFAAGTSPFLADTDGDDLNDDVELNGSLNPFKIGHNPGDSPGGVPGEPTDPLLADSDDDTISDFDELDNANGSITNPNSSDTDGDTLFDNEEIDNGLDPNDPNGDNGADGDPDEDFLTNLDEVIEGTDPFLADTDDDDLTDKEEVDGSLNSVFGFEPTNPLVADSDFDGISDFVELDNANGSITNPNNGDTDEDTFKDLIEIEGGSLPNDFASTPTFPAISWSAQNFDAETDLSTDGTLLFADNFQGDDVTLNGILFTSRMTDAGATEFSSPNLQTFLDTSAPPINVPGFYDDEVPALAPLVSTFWYVNDPDAVNIGITGLTSGKSYIVEFGRVDDRSGNIINRYMVADSFGGGVETDPIGSTNLTYGGPDNPAILLTGTFTATSSVQSFVWAQYLDNDTLLGSHMAFIQVREVEAPSSVTVTDVRYTGATAEVDFANLDLGKTYQLVRSADLLDGFPTVVDGPRSPAGVTDTFTDSSPLVDKGFYRLEETP